jgi:hypothetical protein
MQCRADTNTKVSPVLLAGVLLSLTWIAMLFEFFVAGRSRLIVGPARSYRSSVSGAAVTKQRIEHFGDPSVVKLREKRNRATNPVAYIL